MVIHNLDSFTEDLDQSPHYTTLWSDIPKTTVR